MGRIDDALRRAKGGPAPVASASGPDAADEEKNTRSTVPPSEVFSAPWDFPADVPAAEEAEPGAASAQHTQRGAGSSVGPRQAPGRSVKPGGAQGQNPSPVGVDGSTALHRAAGGTLVQPPGAGDHAGAARPLPPGPMAVFKEFDPRVAERLVVSPKAKGASVEQYRKLGGTLHHAQLENGTRVVMVSSALPGEGKTLTSTNLALTLSESFRRRVLLIDADLRRPSLHELFQVPNLSGLGNGLRADGEERLPIIQVTPTLSLLTAGRPDPDPMSGLSSPRMRQIIEEAAAAFDWVIIDTPPVGLLPDANLLASMVDTTLLVIQAGQAPYDLVQKAVNAIGRERILGVVLNRAEDALRIGYHGKYYRYYDRPAQHEP